MRGVGEVEHRDAALIPRLHHDVAAGHRNQRAVVRDAVLLFGLRRRHLVVAGELQLAIDDVEDGVGAPVRRIGRAAARTRAATPFVGEDHLGAVVVERRRMPVGEVLVDDLIEPHRVHRVGDVEQDAVARAGAGGEADLREHGDVVALVGDVDVFCVPGPWSPPGHRPEIAPVAGSAKMRGRLTIRAFSGAASGTWITSMLNSAVLGSSFGSRPEQPELLARPHRAGARSVDVEVRVILRIDHERVRVRAAAGLHGGDLLRLPDVADVEDAHAAETLGADRASTPCVPQSSRRASAPPT